MQKLTVLSDDVTQALAPWQLTALDGFATLLPPAFSLVLSAEPARGELLLVTEPTYVAAHAIIPTDAATLVFDGADWPTAALATVHSLVRDVQAMDAAWDSAT